MILVPIHEHNDCHTPAGSPAGGQFCSQAGFTIPEFQTPGARVTTGFAGQAEGFELRAQGASQNGYIRDADFPGARASATRGELFWGEVPVGQRGRGLGRSLAMDALRLLQANGTTTVNIAPTSAAGRGLVAALVRDGVLMPLRTSPTGKAEYKIARLQEHNDCHTPAGSPEGGQFCSTVTRVGITSARPPGEPDYRTSRTVYKDMAVVATQLAALPGVKNVSVTPGVGAWKGGMEPSWIVGYRGNGEARRLLARVGAQFNQDAVLLMHGCKGADCDPAVEFHFDKPIGRGLMGDVGQLLGAEGLGGWTWGKRGGKTVLRMVSVPAWGGKRALHLDITSRLSILLAGAGLSHKTRVKMVRTEVMERHQYAGELGKRL